MKHILLIHGPNLNKLGERSAEHYGSLTLEELERLCTNKASEFGWSISCFQSNHEGALIDFIQSNAGDGIIINPGALTHYGYALYDALNDKAIPTVEVHLSDIKSREKWRKISVIKAACIAQISGKKENSYLEAFDIIKAHL